MERLTEWIGTGDSRKALARQDRRDIGDKDCIARLAAYEDAIPLEQAQELAQAEKDGRLVVLPCKPGQTIWVESWIRGRSTSIEAPDVTWIIENTERFGVEIFLTREEAEAALKKREEADNEAD